MKVIKFSASTNELRLVPSSFDDLYLLARIIGIGDSVTASTYRRFRPSEEDVGEQKEVVIEVSVEKVEIDKNAYALRLTGKILSGRPLEYVRMGSYHTLNIGAGGDIAGELARAGIHATAVDIDPERNPDVLASIETLEPFADNTVDAIFCIEVLEHVSLPHAAAGAIHRVLRPGGLVIGSTPFLLGIHDQPRDYYRYTSHGLDHIFSGFQQLALFLKFGELMYSN